MVRKTPTRRLRLMPRQKEPSTVFGARLIALRRARGLTQTQLAERIGGTQRAISYYEASGGNPDLPIVAKLATALGVSTDELLGADQESPAEAGMDTAQRRTWRRFRQLMALPEKDRRAVLRMLDSLSKTHHAAKGSNTKTG